MDVEDILEIEESDQNEHLVDNPEELHFRNKFEQLKPHLENFDIVLRIILVLTVLGNFGLRYYKDPEYYTKTDIKLILISIVILLVGVQNSSILFFPFNKKYIVQLYMTFLLVYISLTLETFEGYLLVKPPTKDLIFKGSYYLFTFTMIPNVTCILFCCFLFFIFMFFIFVLQFMSAFGYDIRPWRDIRVERIQNRAEIFKKKYKHYLNGHFYKVETLPKRDFMSLDEESIIEDKSLMSLKEAISCNENKNIEKSKKLKNKIMNNSNENNESVCSENGCCSICYLNFRNGAFLIELPSCLHIFHYTCISSWLDKNPSCPVCRFDLFKYFVEKEQKRQR